MVGVVIASHGSFAKALLESAELLAGKQENVRTCGLNYGDDINQFGDTIEKYIDEVDQGDGVILFSDIFGGSPCNRAMMCVEKKKIYIVSGANMPMMLDVFLGRESPGVTSEMLYNRCVDSAIEGIKKVNELLVQNN